MRKHAFWIWLSIMLAIILATMIAAPLHAQEYVKVGMTYCGADNKPHIVVDTTEDSTDLINTEIHEQVHVYQMSHYPGGCHAAQHRYMTDPQYRFDMELEAYCIANALEPNRKPLSVSIREISTLMWEIYGNAWPWYDLVVKFTIIECTDVYRLSGG